VVVIGVTSYGCLTIFMVDFGIVGFMVCARGELTINDVEIVTLTIKIG